MISGEDFNEEQKGLLRNAYHIMHSVADQCHMANIPWSVQMSERTRDLHDLVDRVAGAGIDPAELVAVHVLGYSLECISEFRREEEKKELTKLLYDMTDHIMGSAMRQNVEDWAKGSTMKLEELEKAGSWSKLAATRKYLSYLSLATSFENGVPSSASDLIKKSVPFLEACKGLGHEIDTYCAERLQEAQSKPALKQDVQPATPDDLTL